MNVFQTCLCSMLEKYKNFVIIGEAGSGKTEVSIAFSAAVKSVSDKAVHLFDMDQTKTMLRARDYQDAIRAGGVTLHFDEQYMDSPTVVPGIIEKLKDASCHVVLDIGGGAYGSHMIGQFEQWLNKEDTKVLYLINPYRPWSIRREDVDETLRRTAGAAKLQTISITANPNLGPETDIDTVLSGLDRIKKMFPEAAVEFLCAEQQLAGEAEQRSGIPTLAVKRLAYPNWLE